ncbi:MAG: hypothetical protein KDD70_00960 [Bdellovibrionales bacterium]|nr:hypothetical protein [Bdellovibrionales bacterium]
MTRIPENFISQRLLTQMLRNKGDVAKYGEEVSTGYKVQEPGDSNYSSTVSQMRGVLEEIDGQQSRVATAMGYLQTQDSVFGDLNDVLVRANEIAAQAANETNSPETRAQLAAEVYEIRNQVISLGNSKYLGRFLFAGGADNNPAYDTGYAGAGNQFTVPGTAGDPANDVYGYTTNADASLTRTVPVTNDLSVQVNASGSGIFNDAIRGLTQLGRALSGYQTVWTTTDPPVPDQAQSVAYNFPTDFNQQTQDIQAALDLIESSRATDVVPARTAVAGRMRRLQSAESLLDLSKTSAQEILTNLQQADVFESATRLTEAQTALNASLQVTTQLLGQSILDFL